MENTSEEDVGLETLSRATSGTSSILRRKSTLPPKPPEAIHSLSFLWSALGESIAETLKQNISTAFIFENWNSFSPSPADYENLEAANALFFKAACPEEKKSIESDDTKNDFAVILGQKIISEIISTKLDASNDVPPISDDDTKEDTPEALSPPSALDLLLCATTADCIIEQIALLQNSLLPPTTNLQKNTIDQPAFKRIQNSFNLEDLNLGPERFICIQLFFSDKEVEDNESQADDNEPKPELSVASNTHDISFWLPLSLIEMLQDAVKMQNLIVNCNTDDPWFKNMLKSMLATPLRVDARLSEMNLTIAECSKLSVSQILPLGDGRLDAVSLVTSVNQGEYEISSGALCIWGEHKSIQLSQDPSADFIMDISNLVDASRTK